MIIFYYFCDYAVDNFVNWDYLLINALIQILLSVRCHATHLSMMDNTIIRTSSSFYSVSSSDQPNNNPLAYCGAGESNEQALSAEQHRSDIHGVAASPQLEMSSVDEIKDNRLVHQRQRSSSAPPELLMYQQVALQLRGISDEFNQEYSHDEVCKQSLLCTAELLESCEVGKVKTELNTSDGCGGG